VPFDQRDCPACSRQSQSRYRAANPEKKRAADARYYAANREKLKARTAARYAANREAMKRYQVKWYAANAAKVKAAAEKWYAENRERGKANANRWRRGHPELRRIHGQNRRAKERANGGVLSRGLVTKLHKLQRGKCACCGQPLGQKYHLDHRMPLNLGGPNEDWNMQLLRPRCNAQKQAKDPVDFMQSRGFLL